MEIIYINKTNFIFLSLSPEPLHLKLTYDFWTQEIRVNGILRDYWKLNRKDGIFSIPNIILFHVNAIRREYLSETKNEGIIIVVLIANLIASGIVSLK